MGFFERKKKKAGSMHRRSLVAACALCCNPKQDNDDDNRNHEITKPIPVSGNGDKKILLVRNAPTSYIETSKNWFARSNRTPSFTCNALENVDIDPQQDCWMTGAVGCPDKTQLLSAMECCLPNLRRTIQQLQPVFANQNIEKFHQNYRQTIKTIKRHELPVRQSV